MDSGFGDDQATAGYDLLAGGPARLPSGTARARIRRHDARKNDLADPEFDSVEEAMRRLDVSKEELERAVSSGKIRIALDGDTLKLRRSDVEEHRARIASGSSPPVIPARPIRAEPVQAGSTSSGREPSPGRFRAMFERLVGVWFKASLALGALFGLGLVLIASQYLSRTSSSEKPAETLATPQLSPRREPSDKESSKTSAASAGVPNENRSLVESTSASSRQSSSTAEPGRVTKEEVAKASIGQPPSIEALQAFVSAYIKERLRDPDSARFDWRPVRKVYYEIPSQAVLDWAKSVAEHGDLATPIKSDQPSTQVQFGWCLRVGVNAKNGFGGYAGTRTWKFLFRNGALVALGSKGLADGIDQGDWWEAVERKAEQQSDYYGGNAEELDEPIPVQIVASANGEAQSRPNKAK